MKAYCAGKNYSGKSLECPVDFNRRAVFHHSDLDQLRRMSRWAMCGLRVARVASETTVSTRSSEAVKSSSGNEPMGASSASLISTSDNGCSLRSLGAKRSKRAESYSNLIDPRP